MDDFARTERNKVKRLPQRAQYDRETIYRIIDEAPISHVGFTQEDQPVVIPMLHARIDDTLYFHGAHASRLLKLIGAGHPMSVAFTLLDGLVLARSVFHHSVNYRSAVVFGTGKLVESDEEKLIALEALTEHIAPGRWADARQPNRKELDATTVIALRIESASAKIRTGPPVDDEADYALPVWAGVVPLHLQALGPIDDPKLSERYRRPQLCLELQKQRKEADRESQDGSMSGKVCLVTGATAGIGFATAVGLARQGATVVGVGRNPDKCQAVAAQIRQETGNPAVEFMQADLSAQAEVRRLAEEFQRSHPRLDVLVNNVGAFFMSRRLSADGIEMTWALNYLGVYLLTELLLDTLVASAPREASLEHSGRESRVVNVSSAMHTSARINFDDLQGQRKYSGQKAYGQSKLAQVMYTYDLARRLAGTGVTVNALHPGFVASSMYQSSGGAIKLLAPIIKLMAISPEAGAETSIYVAASPEVEGVTGKYFVKQQAVASADASYDTAATARLMALTAAMVGQDGPS